MTEHVKSQNHVSLKVFTQSLSNKLQHHRLLSLIHSLSFFIYQEIFQSWTLEKGKNV
jgi:hypothetical protein